jgi:PAS domain S-box-containing protein
MNNGHIKSDDLEQQVLSKLLVEQMPVGLFRKDVEGRYILVNSEFCKLRGKRPEEILGRRPDELAASAARDANEASLLKGGANHHAEIMRTGELIEVEEAYTRPNGEEFFLHVVKCAAFDSSGNITGTQGIMMDNMLNKRVEAALAYERDLLNNLLTCSEDKIYFKDCESKFVRVSVSMATLFKVEKPSDLIGKSDRDFFSEEHGRAALEDERRIISTGESLVGKVEKETWPDGRVTWALTTKMAMRNAEGKIVGTFGISKDITAVKEAEAKLEQVHRQLVDASRQAGMAEVATSVLHNVGNVLNSVNVSSSVIADKIRKSKASSLGKVVALIKEHENNLGDFFANDPKGKQLPAYLASLAAYLAQEQQEVMEEVKSLAGNIMHIKDIVTTQQNYAKTVGVVETLPVAGLVEDALQLNKGALTRHNVKLVRDFADVPPIVTEKHKVLQILVNLIRNAKYACDDLGTGEKQITLKVSNGDGRVKIAVIDNGIGIAPENLTRIFNHGFTTRKEGHGFGLHNGCIVAKELGGSLTAFSEGPGRGATFTLELPVNTKKTSNL